MKRGIDIGIGALLALTAPLMILALWMAFLYAPEERVMGAAQRIFYFHVPAAIVTFAGVFLLLAGSIAYLWTRDRRWDDFSRAATEVSLLFCTLVLITGPIWARPAWGVWWTWEARLTTTLVLWMLLVGCLTLRNLAPEPDLGARLAAVSGIFAAIDVPIIHMAVKWWRGHHPQVFAPGNEESMDPKMAQAFGICSLTFVLLFLLLFLVRWRGAMVEQRWRRFLAERQMQPDTGGGTPR